MCQWVCHIVLTVLGDYAGPGVSKCVFFLCFFFTFFWQKKSKINLANSCKTWTRICEIILPASIFFPAAKLIPLGTKTLSTCKQLMSKMPAHFLADEKLLKSYVFPMFLILFPNSFWKFQFWNFYEIKFQENSHQDFRKLAQESDNIDPGGPKLWPRWGGKLVPKWISKQIPKKNKNKNTFWNARSKRM